MAVPISGKEKRLFVKVGIVLAVAYGIVWGAERLNADYTGAVSNENRTLKSQLADFRTRLSEINEEAKLQSDYVEDYNNYLSRNLIAGRDILENDELAAELDEQRRLYVLERLQQIKEQRKFFDIGYSLQQPENLPATFSELTADSDVAIRANLMTVNMPLLHSLDLLMLLNDFYDPVSNRFTPVFCELSFADDPIEFSKDEALLLELKQNIVSNCTLVWLSVYDPQLNFNQGGQVEEQS